MGELAQAAGKLEQQELEVELELPRGAARVPCLVTVSPGAQPRVGAVLMHGAGGNLHSGHLPRFAAALAAAGAVCVRFTARAPNLAYRARVCEALLEQLPQRSPACAAVRRWLLCGHSLGARVAVQVAHDLPHLALACVLLSFPLHPPGKPQQVRDDPLTQLRLPVLAVRGTGDEFSGALLWAGVLERMQTRQLEVHSVEGGDHGLCVKGRGGQAASEAALAAACQAVTRFAAAAVQQVQEATAGAAGRAEGEEGGGGSAGGGRARAGVAQRAAASARQRRAGGRAPKRKASAAAAGQQGERTSGKKGRA